VDRARAPRGAVPDRWAGQIANISLQTVKFQKVELPNAPVANTSARQNPRTQVVTDMAFADGRLWVAGLSNEEFASKLRAIPYPFATVDRGVSVEIYHGNHKAVETRSPVNAFVPYTLNNQQHLIAGYTCTPLVKFPITDLKAGEKVRGTTIAEFGAGNRVLDMIVYKKGGQEFLLTANNSRGVMKIPTAPFASAKPITTPVESETAGVPFEKVTSMMGVEQLDKLDDTTAIVISRSASAASISRPCRCRSAPSIAAPRGGDRFARHRRGVRPFRQSPVQSGDHADQPAERPRLRRGHGTAVSCTRRPRDGVLVQRTVVGAASRRRR
jgi:hypothetical protein